MESRLNEFGDVLQFTCVYASAFAGFAFTGTDHRLWEEGEAAEKPEVEYAQIHHRGTLPVAI